MSTKKANIYYTDGSQIGDKIGAAVVYCNRAKKWNLGPKVDNNDAELWAIQKALEWALEEHGTRPSRNLEIWIFTDSQESIRVIDKFQVEQAQIHELLAELGSLGYFIHLH